MTEKTRIAVIGTGYLGRLHARVLTEMPEAEVVGFVEHHDEKAEEIERTLALRRFPSVESIAPEIECAVIATPTLSHAAVAEYFLSNGCDVMIEKPITTTLNEGERLIALAREKGRLIQVGHVERYNPAVAAIAKRIDEPRYVEADRLGVWVGRSLDIDVLLDLMIHDLHLVLSLLGKRVVSVQAVGVPVLTDKVDMANVRLELENGAVANLTASRVSNERVRKFRLFGHDSYLSVDTKEQEVKGYRLVTKEGARAIEPLEIQVERKEPLRAELESFVHAVRTRTRPLVSGEDGLAALELAIRVSEEIDRSMQRWQP
ncbi:MAG TPA: Gfo/Idh/MocA family oxidoreductase [Thermoanaerobaculia bacterium]